MLIDIGQRGSGEILSKRRNQRNKWDISLRRCIAANDKNDDDLFAPFHGYYYYRPTYANTYESHSANARD